MTTGHAGSQNAALLMLTQTDALQLNLGTRKKTIIEQAGVLYEEVTAVDQEKYALYAPGSPRQQSPLVSLPGP